MKFNAVVKGARPSGVRPARAHLLPTKPSLTLARGATFDQDETGCKLTYNETGGALVVNEDTKGFVQCETSLDMETSTFD